MPSSDIPGGQYKIDNFMVAQGKLLPVGIPAIQVSNTAEAKTMADGVVIDLSNVEVTKAFNGFFYVEDATRASGIRVESSTAVSAGDKVLVIGAVATEGSEKKIAASSVTRTAGQPTIKPLGMNNASIQPNLGVNTVGLLVTVWGKVKSSGSGYIMINDGAGNDLRVNLGFDYTGYSYPDSTKYLLVTGVHGKTSGTVIHVDRATDIRALDTAP